MPTSRPRQLVTETDELAQALYAAAVRWPGLSRPQLLVRLALHGHDGGQQARAARRTKRLEALHKHSGALTSAYGPDYLRQLRTEWPE